MIVHRDNSSIPLLSNVNAVLDTGNYSIQMKLNSITDETQYAFIYL